MVGKPTRISCESMKGEVSLVARVRCSGIEMKGKGVECDPEEDGFQGSRCPLSNNVRLVQAVSRAISSLSRTPEMMGEDCSMVAGVKGMDSWRTSSPMGDTNVRALTNR